MCSKLAPLPPPLKPRTTPRIRAKTTPRIRSKTTPRIRAKTTLRPPSARKTRSKTRKPKYLSLRLELSQDSSSKMTSSTTTTATPTSDHHQQLNLFPLHPENLVDQDRLLDSHDQDHNMMAASFFSAADDGDATTLTGLLSSTVTLTNSSDEDNLSPSSLNYGHEEGEHNELVRTAMRRNKERDQGGAEEKWVRYSEVVEEVSSSTACGKPRRYWNGNNRNTTAAVVAAEQQKRQGLSLKLDYDEIMNAWSDKGPLYINHSTNNSSNSAMDDQLDSPQMVPDLLLRHDHEDTVNNGLWRVPEIGEEETKDGGGDIEAAAAVATPGEYWEWKAVGGGAGQSSQREASVQRYKEKRQNRLFAKKIRYQVRKLNAEKRPRIKGRFVKRSS